MIRRTPSSGSAHPLAEHHSKLYALTDQAQQLHKALSPSQRMTMGAALALRAVLAASLGYFGSRAFGFPQGYWAAITAISVSQGSYADVQNSSRDQFLGAVIGGLIGMGVATLAHDQYLSYLGAVMIGMILCSIFNLSAAGRISGTTTTIIMLVPHEGAFWQIALFRLGEVTLGAASTLLVSALFNVLERRLFRPQPKA